MTNPHPASNPKSTFRTASIALVFVLVPGVLASQSARAQVFTILYSFRGMPDGEVPAAGLLRDPKGNLYGTTSEGGNTICYQGCGTVFKIDADGKETVLHNFGYHKYGHGQSVQVGLVRDSTGNLYGTTPFGGQDETSGTVFKVSPTGKETVLHKFKRGAEGFFPQARVVRDSSGNLYGTTVTGGNSTGSGVVFKLNKFGRETVLYSFTCYVCNGQSGGGFGDPYEGVIRDSSGNFYGVAAGGKVTSQCPSGCGVVYKLDKNGTGAALYSFAGGMDGSDPVGNLIMDAAGNLYGTTKTGGGSHCNGFSGGCGTVFKVDPSGNETVLYTFNDGMDGGYPLGGLARDSQGNLYGTTQGGGRISDCFCGVVFKLDPNGNETTLHAFARKTGWGPNPDLIADAAGNLYGTTMWGGHQNLGVVYKITP
jgi:uncharacterized repeat protein (TIGR03803 family)